MRTLPGFLTELGDQHPSLREALLWVTWVVDLWNALPHGTGILFGFVVLWFLLRRERKRLSERIETLRQIITAVSDQAEEEEVVLAQTAPTSRPPPLPAPNGAALPGAPRDELGNWLTVRSLWRDIRDRLELLIEDISSSRVRGKYSKMPRRRYRDIINALERDRELTPKVADELNKMETLFNRARFRPRGVTDTDAAIAIEIHNLVSAFLPRSPDGPTQIGLPSGMPPEILPDASQRAA